MDITTKIRALLRKAEDPAATEPERQAFNAKAAELMTRHLIDRHQLGDLDDGTQRRKVGQIRMTVDIGVYQKVQEAMAAGLARAFGMEILIVGKDRDVGKRGANILEVWGIEGDLQIYEALFTSLLVQAAQGIQADRTLMLADCPKPGHQIQWKNSWMRGFFNTATTRIKDARRQVVEAAATGSSLVLQSDADLVKDEFNKRFGRLGSGRGSSSRTHHGAHSAGSAAGRSADVGNSRMPSSRKALR